MAHFSLVFRKASDPLAYREVQQRRQKREQLELNVGVEDRPLAKQSRLSRPNTSEEIRRKRSNRRRKKRQEERKLSKKSLKIKLQQRFKNTRKQDSCKFTEKIMCEKNRADENRKKAVHFWTEWRKEKSLRQKDM